MRNLRNGGRIGTQNLPALGAAKGLWGINDVQENRIAGLWPGHDPLWANVQLLLVNDNQADGSVAFTDQSAANRTVTVSGNAQYDTAQAPSGMTSSFLSDGTGDGISVADAASLEPGSGDFCIEVAFRVNGTPSGAHHIVGKGSAYGPFVIYHSDANLYLVSSSDGANWDVALNSAFGTISGNTHYTVVLARTGTSLEGYLGATRGFQITTSATLKDNATRITVGADFDDSTCFNGWIGPVRYTVGNSRGYTGATITPPTFPFPFML